MFESIRAKNILSFGDPGIDLALTGLNVLIGPNSSGKSNLISLFSLLRQAPSDISKPVSVAGGVAEWLWKGGMKRGRGELAVAISHAKSTRYSLAFEDREGRFALTDERIERARSTIYAVAGVRGQFGFGRQKRIERVDPDVSVLAQRRGPQYPEITALAQSLENISIYQDWDFGLNSRARYPQRTDAFNGHLLEDASNLALVINRMEFDGTKGPLDEQVKLAIPNASRVMTFTSGGGIQVYVEEPGLRSPTPASRLSQGSLQWLCLLALLLQPEPPGLICLEEPEKGLHPDILPELAKLLLRASGRCQLIVSTHSDTLVDALSEHAESVLVCEKEQNATSIQRLDPKALEDWLRRYSLGQLWSRGAIGGNRW